VRIFSPETKTETTNYNIFVVNNPETAITIAKELSGVKTVTNEPDKNNEQTPPKEDEIY
jgi:hypothetical protein